MYKKILIITVFLFSITVSLYAKNSESGIPTLMMDGFGSRIMGMSGVFTGIANDINTITVNPSGLGTLNRIETSIMYLRYPLEINFIYGAFGYPIKGKRNWSTVAVSISGFFMSNFEHIDGVGNITGKQLGANDIVITAGYGIDIFRLLNYKKRLCIGANIKVIKTTLAERTKVTVGFDLGALFKMNMYSLNKKNISDGLSFGLSINNIGKSVQFVSEKTKLPLDIKVGVAYNILEFKKSNLLLGFDISIPNDSRISLDIGLEYSMIKMIILRAGFNILGRETDVLTFGMGGNIDIKKVTLTIDYSLVPMFNIGIMNVFSVGMKF